MGPTGLVLHFHLSLTVNVGRISQVLWGVTRPARKAKLPAVNEGRISQVLWASAVLPELSFQSFRQRRTDFSGIVGFCRMWTVKGMLHRQRRTDFSGIVGLQVHIDSAYNQSRQRRTDFSGIVGPIE